MEEIFHFELPSISLQPSDDQKLPLKSFNKVRYVLTTPNWKYYTQIYPFHRYSYAKNIENIFDFEGNWVDLSVVKDTPVLLKKYEMTLRLAFPNICRCFPFYSNCYHKENFLIRKKRSSRVLKNRCSVKSCSWM